MGVKGSLALTWGVEGVVGRDGGRWGPIRPLALCGERRAVARACIGVKGTPRAHLGSGGGGGARWRAMGSNPAPRALLGSGGGMDGVVVAWGSKTTPSRSVGERKGMVW